MKTSLNKLFFSSGISNKVVPLPLIYIYPILVIADIYLTYLCSPDLEYESNIIVKALNFDWLGIVFGANIIVVLIIILIIKANKVFAKSNYQSKIIANYHELILCIAIVFFYAHFFSSLFVVINNYLSYIFLYGKTNFILKELSIKYVHFYQRNISWYNTFIFSVLSIIGLIVTVLRLHIIKTNSKIQ